jgi:Flp pilus assembly protein TadD
VKKAVVTMMLMMHACYWARQPRNHAVADPQACMVTPEVAAALDRTRISNRNATYVLAAAAQSLGHNPADMAINREFIRQAQRRNREKIAREIQASFSPDVPLTDHWDGKLLPTLMSKETVDRLAVLCLAKVL